MRGGTCGRERGDESITGEGGIDLVPRLELWGWNGTPEYTWVVTLVRLYLARPGR